MRIRAHRPWTEADDQNLRDLAAQGMTLLRIAAKLKRTVKARGAKLHVSLREPVRPRASRQHQLNDQI